METWVMNVLQMVSELIMHLDFFLIESNKLTLKFIMRLSMKMRGQGGRVPFFHY